jgi:hypothetical protein
MTTLTAPLSKPRLAEQRVRRLSPDLLDYVLFWPGIWLACGLGVGFSLVGSWFVVVPVALCLLYGVLQLVVPPRLLTVYFAFCIFAGVLSAYGLFPTSWQTHFMDEAIIRQLVPTFGFFAVGWAAKAYFRKRLRNGNVFVGAPFVLALSFGGALLAAFYLGSGYQGDYSVYAKIASLGAFLNNTLIGLFFITGHMFLARDWRRYAGLGAVLGIAVTTHFVQFWLWTLVTLAMFGGAPARKVVIGMIAILIVTYAVAMKFTPQIIITHPNDGLRLVMIEDGLLSTIDTRGVGIGYGRESVKARYIFPEMPDFTFLPDWSSMTEDRKLRALSNSAENSFAMTLFRTGILGLCVLVAAIFAAFPPRDLPRDVRNHANCLFAMMFIACFVNAGLDTPLQVVGHGFVYGYLLALRAAAGMVTTKRTWSNSLARRAEKGHEEPFQLHRLSDREAPIVLKKSGVVGVRQG